LNKFFQVESNTCKKYDFIFALLTIRGNIPVTVA